MPRKRPPKPALTEAVAAIPATAVPAEPSPRRFRRVVGLGLLVAAAIAAALLLVGRQDEAPARDPAAAGAMSAQELASFASSHAEPVYWAGPSPSRTLELTSTEAGTFVRYLAAGAPAGGPGRSLTVATYPLQGAYATAVRRAEAKGMISRPLVGKGVAVWSEAQPTSVYLAFRGVPSLVEVYAPQATEARTLALSGRIRPVR